MSDMDIRNFSPDDLGALNLLFAEIAADKTADRFHPHPFTADWAKNISTYQGKDFYLGLFQNDILLGYGMLRGFDEGYAIPSLGIYLAAAARGKGLAKSFMEALHQKAKEAKAPSVRLKVYEDNTPALRLYQNLGYDFSEKEAGQLVGFYHF